MVRRNCLRLGVGAGNVCILAKPKANLRLSVAKAVQFVLLPAPTEKEEQGASSVKQVLISLRDPNGVAVRPSGFDCVRPCHSERSVAKSNCEAAPSKAKVESRADSAQDDTQGQHLPKKSKGVRTILFVLLFTRPCLQGNRVLHLSGVLSGGEYISEMFCYRKT